MELQDFKLDIIGFLESKNYLHSLPEDERKAFITKAHELFENPVLFTVINYLINEQACKSILQAPDSQRIMLLRAGIDVLDQLKAEFQKLDGMFISMSKENEYFDEHEVI